MPFGSCRNPYGRSQNTEDRIQEKSGFSSGSWLLAPARPPELFSSEGGDSVFLGCGDEGEHVFGAEGDQLSMLGFRPEEVGAN